MINHRFWPAMEAQTYSFEAGNVRHEHEWTIWKDIKLPADKSIMPGVVSHATNIIESTIWDKSLIVLPGKIVREGLRHPSSQLLDEESELEQPSIRIQSCSFAHCPDCHLNRALSDGGY
jgi:hypothetical protein